MSTLYMNALGYESHYVIMESTSNEINKSNMHIIDSQCVLKKLEMPGKYGINYMESVSLDQVMIKNHKDIQRVQLMKIDVEVSL